MFLDNLERGLLAVGKNGAALAALAFRSLALVQQPRPRHEVPATWGPGAAKAVAPSGTQWHPAPEFWIFWAKFITLH
jgi:hypothetical protein